MSQQTSKKQTNGEHNPQVTTSSDIPAPAPQADQSGILSELVDADSLQEGSKNILRNLRTRDLPLSFLKEPEVNEFRWKLRIKRELFFAAHPGDDCLVTGEDRAAINDDADDTLTPLSREEEMVARDYFDIVESRMLRSRDMKQQEMMRTRIREHRADQDDDSGGGLLGRLRGD